MAALWLKEHVNKVEEESHKLWTLSKVYAEKVEEEVVDVMGKLGAIGLYIESSMLTMKALQ